MGVGCGWCVGICFFEHVAGRVSEPRDAFSCLVSDFVMGGCSFVVVSREGVGPLARSVGLVGDRCQWFPPPFLPLCLSGRW